MGTIQLSGVGRSFKSTAAVSDIDLIIEDAAAQITESTGAPSMSASCVITGGSWCMQGLFLSNGAQVLSDDRTTIEFGSDAAIDTVATFTEMYEDGVLTNEDFTSQYEAFAQGKTAIHVNGSALQVESRTLIVSRGILNDPRLPGLILPESPSQANDLGLSEQRLHNLG